MTWDYADMNRTARQRKRLQMLIDEIGTQTGLAAKVGTADAYISQLLNLRDGIARKFCEKLEKAMNKPDGWMDQWLPEESDRDLAAAAPKKHKAGVARPDLPGLIADRAADLDPPMQAEILRLIEVMLAASGPARRKKAPARK